MTAVPPFADFFRAATGHEPYLWQAEVADRFRKGEVTRAVDVPTGLGKTGIVHAWCWALATQAAEIEDGQRARRTVPLRLHMVVDRRVVVDDTHRVAQTLADRLAAAQDGPIAEVAAALRTLDADPETPLAVRVLRGGMDERPEHVRSVTTPTVAVGTVDMVMSRLLWRGYGVTVGRRPLDAALVGVDSMIVLDEAHLAPQAVKTLDVLTEHADVLARGDLPGLQVVVMSATLPVGRESDAVCFRRAAEVEQSPELGARLARRAATTITTLTGALSAAQVVDRRPTEQGTSLVVFCNTASRARRLVAELERVPTIKEEGAEVVLLHGGMPLPVARRGLDAVESFHTGARTTERATRPPTILVTTQTLEVGADLDFDHAITEPAPLDSLVQRIGRVNRAGARDGATVTVTGVGPVRGPRIGPYPAAVVAAVHERLGSVGTVEDLDALVESVRQDLAAAEALVAPRAAVTTIDAPTLLDLTVTEGLPGEDPVSAWIRLPDDDRRVDVVVRDGLEHLDPAALDGYLTVFPARRGEAWSVPVQVAETLAATRRRTVVTAPGTDPVSHDAGDPGRVVLRPGSTVYVATTDADRPTTSERESVATYDGLREDLSSQTVGTVRPVLPLIWGSSHDPGLDGNAAYVSDDFTDLVPLPDAGGVDPFVQHVREMVAAPDKAAPWVVELLSGDAPLAVEQEGACWYLTTAKTAGAASPERARQPETLEAHSRRVAELARQTATRLHLTELEARTIEVAAHRHDWGKVDPAFQRQLAAVHERGRLLLGAGSSDEGLPGAASDEPRAKSGLPPRFWAAVARAVGVVPGWRHEALSVALSDEVPAPDGVDRELLRHLVGTHHGHLRGLVEVLGDGVGDEVRVPPGRLAGVDEPIKAHNALQSAFDPLWWTQFGALTKRYGPYHLALLEAVLRFADWHASGETEDEVAVPIGEDTDGMEDLA